jgi:hypothetical protein
MVGFTLIFATERIVLSYDSPNNKRLNGSTIFVSLRGKNIIYVKCKLALFFKSRSVTVWTGFRARGRSCGICSEHIGTETGGFRAKPFFP